MDDQSKPIVVKCKICSKEFITCKNRQEIGRGKYCSRQCQYDSLKRSVSTNCAICNKLLIKKFSETFIRNKIGNKRRKRHYCSKICRRIGSSKFDSTRVIKYAKENKGFDKLVLGKKGKSISYDGYYVFSDQKVHRLIMERHIGRKLDRKEIVHHINHNKLDNRIENLQIMTRAEHNRLHFKK